MGGGGGMVGCLMFKSGDVICADKKYTWNTQYY